MAQAINHDFSELASRLEAAADGIVNAASVGLERDLREGSRALRAVGKPASIADMVGELNRIANDCTDSVTRERLRRLLGGA